MFAGVIVSVVTSSVGSYPGRVTTTFTVSGPSSTSVTLGGVEPFDTQSVPFHTKYSTVSVGLVPVSVVVCGSPSYVQLPPVRSTVKPPLTTFRSPGSTVSS